MYQEPGEVICIRTFITRYLEARLGFTYLPIPKNYYCLLHLVILGPGERA
jgi:hypothetical protein